MKSFLYRKLICGHWYSGQIKSTRSEDSIKWHGKVRHYRECQKCGNRDYID
jgi:hypothetical protein